MKATRQSASKRDVNDAAIRTIARRTVMSVGRRCVLVDPRRRCWASDFHSQMSSTILDFD
jgi:hypothetical protein